MEDGRINYKGKKQKWKQPKYPNAWKKKKIVITHNKISQPCNINI